MSAVILHEDEPKLPAQVASTPMELLSKALDRGASIEQLQQLMALQERMEANNARKAFDSAMSDAKAKIKPIAKKRTVDFTTQKGRTNYMYEDLALIAAEVDPILSAVGLSYRYRSKQDGNNVYVTCIISHRDGHFEETTLSAGVDESGNKNGIQGIGSTATYLQRYTLKLALGLSAAKDDDGKGADPQEETISDSELADLHALAEEVGADPEKFLKYMQVERAADIKKKDFSRACAALRAKGNRR